MCISKYFFYLSTRLCLILTDLLSNLKYMNWGSINMELHTIAVATTINTSPIVNIQIWSIELMILKKGDL